MINVVQKNLYNLILIFFALLISLLFYNDQVAVRGGLVISNIITYEDNISPIKYYFLNSWTLLTQLTAIFLKSGLSVKIVSFILVFFLSLILTFSSYLIINKFTEDRFFSLLLTFFIVFFQKNLGDTDYPSLIFTVHTFGAYAQAITGLIIASLLYRNFNITFFLILLLVSIHPIVGFWMFFIFFFSILYLKEKSIFTSSYKGLFFGLLLILISLIFYFYLSIEKIPYDQSLFNAYINLWDGHRARNGSIHYEYIVKSTLLFLAINFFLNKEKYRLFITTLNLIILSSITIYLSFKLINLDKFNLLSTIIPGRFMVTYTFIAWPIFISILFSKFGLLKYFKSFLYFLIFTYSIMHYKDFIKVKQRFIKNYYSYLNFNSENNQNIFKQLRNIENTGNIITSENSTFNTIYLSQKPLLLTRSIDFLPYHPYLVNSVSSILEEIYGYNFRKPKKLYYPYLNDNLIKKIFENRSSDDWLKIKNKFNSNFLITPKSWNINLKLYATDQNFTLYKID